MSNIKAVGTCTITRLRTGNNITITLSQSSGTKYIYYSGGAITTDYSKNPLKVTPSFSAQNGSKITVKSVRWYQGSVTIANLIASTVSTEASGISVARKTMFAVDTDTATIGRLTISSTDFADVANPQSYGFIMVASIVVDNYEHEVTKSFYVDMIKDAANSYRGEVTSDGSLQLSSTHTSVQLTGKLYLAGSEVATYTRQWYKNGVVVTGQTAATYTVNDSDVEGAAYFSCKFFVNGSEVEADGVTVRDETDDTYISIPPEVQVAYGKPATIYPKVYRKKVGENGIGAIEDKTSSVIKWSVAIRCSENDANITSASGISYTWITTDAANPKFTMEEGCMYWNNDTANPKYGSAYTNEFSPIVIFSIEI